MPQSAPLSDAIIVAVAGLVADSQSRVSSPKSRLNSTKVGLISAHDG